jgi:hypothetical protein
MCLKKLFPWLFRPDPVPVPIPVPSGGKKRTALTFAINDYPAASNDLNGCLRDQADVIAMLESTYTALGFGVIQFRDREVTKSTMLREIEKNVLALKAGDLLLIHYSGHGTQVYDPHGDEEDGYDEALWVYDSERAGAVTDDELNAILIKIPAGALVILAFDSCFSESGTRMAMDTRSQGRFHMLHPVRRKLRRRIARGSGAADLGWIAFSGCGEQQTSADAYINGQYHGAFTYFWTKTFSPDLTYIQWYQRLRKYLPSSDFDQIPSLEGRADLINKQVFIN